MGRYIQNVLEQFRCRAGSGGQSKQPGRSQCVDNGRNGRRQADIQAARHLAHRGQRCRSGVRDPRHVSDRRGDRLAIERSVGSPAGIGTVGRIGSRRKRRGDRKQYHIGAGFGHGERLGRGRYVSEKRAGLWGAEYVRSQSQRIYCSVTAL